MNDDPSYIVKARDLASIIENPDKGVIEELLDSPSAVLAALLTDLFTSGPVTFFGPAVRIVQGAFKGEVYKQLGAEILKAIILAIKLGLNCYRLLTMKVPTNNG
jgi:hypothetical protein